MFGLEAVVSSEVFAVRETLHDQPGRDSRMAIRFADRACCCSASPLVRVVYVTVSPTAHSVDLLLCGHHCRRCAAKLASIGAMVFDGDGSLLATDDFVV